MPLEEAEESDGTPQSARPASVSSNKEFVQMVSDLETLMRQQEQKNYDQILQLETQLQQQQQQMALIQQQYQELQAQFHQMQSSV